MAIVRYSYRGYKLLRNIALIFAGALIIVLTLAFPRLFGNSTYGITGVAQADAPGGDGGGSGGASSSGGGLGDGCGGGGSCSGDGCSGDGGDCSY